MKYAVDRIEGNIAICENLDTKEIKEVELNLLPKRIKDGTILIYENNKYKIDKNEEEKRRLAILEKFNRLKKN